MPLRPSNFQYGLPIVCGRVHLDAPSQNDCDMTYEPYDPDAAGQHFLGTAHHKTACCALGAIAALGEVCRARTLSCLVKTARRETRRPAPPSRANSTASDAPVAGCFHVPLSHYTGEVSCAIQRYLEDSLGKVELPPLCRRPHTALFCAGAVSHSVLGFG